MVNALCFFSTWGEVVTKHFLSLRPRHGDMSIILSHDNTLTKCCTSFVSLESQMRRGVNPSPEAGPLTLSTVEGLSGVRPTTANPSHI